MLVSKFSNTLTSGDLARSNLYEIHFGNVKQQESFYSRLGRLLPTSDLKFHARAVTMPNKALGTVDVKRFGASFKMANDLIAGEVTVTFSCSEDFRERQFFDGWVSAISGRDVWTDYKELESDEHGLNVDTVYTMLYYDDYVTKMYIENIARTGARKVEGKVVGRTSQVVELIEAYPINVGSVDLAYGDASDVATFTVTFAIRDWKVVTRNSSDEELELKYANKTTPEMVLGTEAEQAQRLDDQDYRLAMGSTDMLDSMDKVSAPYKTAEYLDKNDEFYALHGYDLDKDESNLLLQIHKDEEFKKKQDDREIAEYRKFSDELDAASDTQDIMEKQTEETDHFLKYGHNENEDEVDIYANVDILGTIGDGLKSVSDGIGKGIEVFVDGALDAADEIASYVTGNPTQGEQAEESLKSAVADQERMEFIADADAEWAHIDKLSEFNKSGDLEGLDEYLASPQIAGATVSGPVDEPENAHMSDSFGQGRAEYNHAYTTPKMVLDEHNDFKNDSVTQHQEDVDWNMDIGNGLGELGINEAVEHGHLEYTDEALDNMIGKANDVETGLSEITARKEETSGIGDAKQIKYTSSGSGTDPSLERPVYGEDNDSQGTSIYGEMNTVFADDDINKYVKFTSWDNGATSGSSQVRASQDHVDRITASEKDSFVFLNDNNSVDESDTDLSHYGAFITTTYLPYPDKENYLRKKTKLNERRKTDLLTASKGELDFYAQKDKAIDSGDDFIYNGVNIDEAVMTYDPDNDNLHGAHEDGGKYMDDIRWDYSVKRKEELTNLIQDIDNGTYGKTKEDNGLVGYIQAILPNVGSVSKWFTTDEVKETPIEHDPF